MNWKMLIRFACVLGIAVFATNPCPAALSAPQGAVVERNRDLAAEKAIDAWITVLLEAPHLDQIQNVGIIRLANDSSDFTQLLAEKLTALKRFHVVILGGKDWNAIEDEMARTDPDGGMGDIMDKATIKWKELRDAYVIPETAKGADALLLGSVRGVDPDWLRARVRLTLHLGRVDTREQVGGGIAEGESMLSWLDLLIYYKVQIVIAIGALVVLIVLLAVLKGILKTMSRPR